MQPGVRNQCSTRDRQNESNLPPFRLMFPHSSVSWTSSASSNFLSPAKMKLTHSQEDIRLSLAILALEDGTVFEGRSFGAPAERSGEVVFNTAITGYQEIFTDPSYSGQIVILTNPQIGNYGTSSEDNESAKPYIEGLAVREFSAIASNWRSDSEANDFLARAGIPVIDDLDTRALVRHLRSRGVMRGVLSSTEKDSDKLVSKARSIPTMAGLD